MKTFTINIDGKEFEYITSKKINKKNYVAYADNDNIYIAEFIIKDGNMKLMPIEEEIVNEIKEALEIE